MRSDDTIDFVIASAVQAFVYFERAFCDTCGNHDNWRIDYIYTCKARLHGSFNHA